MSFNPAALQSLDSSFDDGGDIVDVNQDELMSIVGNDLRQRCAGLKLASRIVGIATANSVQLDDAGVLQSMSDFMRRLSVLRQVALTTLQIDKDSSDFPHVFNSVTNTMLDAATEEWKWSQLDPENKHVLPASFISKLFGMVMKAQPEKFEPSQAFGGDISLTRRLSLLGVIPKLRSLVNLFDYYQADTEAMAGRLVRAVVDSAELYAGLLTPHPSPSFVECAIVERMYAASAGLMCEVYKAEAYRDVLGLQELPDLDRSIAISQYESLGGMNYEHILEKHKLSMDRMIDTANLILESRRKA